MRRVLYVEHIPLRNVVLQKVPVVLLMFLLPYPEEPPEDLSDNSSAPASGGLSWLWFPDAPVIWGTPALMVLNF